MDVCMYVWGKYASPRALPGLWLRDWVRYEYVYMISYIYSHSHATKLLTMHVTIQVAMPRLCIHVFIH